jgi:glucose-1-phosphate thymidylyltransferase
MKAIIPVAGIGSRLRPHTHSQPKSLVPVAGKAILAHIVDALVESGISDFIFITGYLGGQVEDFIKSNYPDINTVFIIQEPREGIGQAVYLADKFIEPDDELLIVLGDTIADIDFKSVLEIPGSSLGVKKVDDPRLFGVAETDNDGIITTVVEKPSIPKSNLALVGVYKINEGRQLIDSINYLINHDIRTLNEFHLTDALMKMISDGVSISTFIVDHWYDCGSRQNLLETNSLLLKKRSVPLPSTRSYQNTIIIEPCFIGKDCDISNSIVGPNVSIGESSVISNTVVNNSIIGSFSTLRNAVIHESIIGSNSSLSGLNQSLNIGDNTEIDFS